MTFKPIHNISGLKECSLLFLIEYFFSIHNFRPIHLELLRRLPNDKYHSQAYMQLNRKLSAIRNIDRPD